VPSSDENVLSGDSVPDETMTQRVEQLISEKAYNGAIQLASLGSH
jgi:hypothetical protein